MAARKPQNIEDNLTFRQEEVEQKEEWKPVTIYLPKLEEEGNGVRVDQYEHVSIANQVKEDCYKVRRGEWVDVPVPVDQILALREADMLPEPVAVLIRRKHDQRRVVDALRFECLHRMVYKSHCDALFPILRQNIKGKQHYIFPFRIMG